MVYFGGEPLGVPVLQELKAAGLLPSLVVCNPDRPSGRGQNLTPPRVKVWADEHNIPIFQPESLKDTHTINVGVRPPHCGEWDLFVVVAYNHIMPKWLIELPKHKTINLHPSLLPKLRGPSPIRTAILEDHPEQIGVSIMLMDEEMDHGPLLAQMKLEIAPENWPMAGEKLDGALANLGGALLADTITKWASGKITPTEQDHTNATYTQKLTKGLGELDLDPYNLPKGESAYQMMLKINGLDSWPGTFFFHNGKRMKITGAMIAEDDSLKINTIIPEGKKEMKFSDYFKESK